MVHIPSNTLGIFFYNTKHFKSFGVKSAPMNKMAGEIQKSRIKGAMKFDILISLEIQKEDHKMLEKQGVNHNQLTSGDIS